MAQTCSFIRFFSIDKKICKCKELSMEYALHCESSVMIFVIVLWRSECVLCSWRFFLGFACLFFICFVVVVSCLNVNFDCD